MASKSLLMFRLLSVQGICFFSMSASLPTSSYASAPTSIASSSSTATPSSVPLYLPVSPAPPDILGMSQVSGIYGPGAWAGWFITIIASWYRLFVERDSKIDPNTWTYLLGTNWAAIDLMRHTHRWKAGENDMNSELGSIGAAFTVVWWGTLHALIQLCVLAFYEPKSAQKPVTLCISLLVPVITLSAELFSLKYLFADDTISRSVPALYYAGMSVSDHPTLLWVACLTGGWLSSVAMIILLVAIVGIISSYSKTFEKILECTCHAVTTIAPVYAGLNFLFLTALGMIPSKYVKPHMVPLWLIIIFDLPLLVLCYFMFPFWALLMFLLYGGMYVWKVYLHHSSSVSQSCFFMPCSPQSISEWDQSFALLLGIFLFVGTEVIPRTLGVIRRRWRDERLFRQEGERRFGIEMGHRGAVPGAEIADESVEPNASIPDAPVTGIATANSTANRNAEIAATVRRVNSGNTANAPSQAS